jgi:hypothetical protein
VRKKPKIPGRRRPKQPSDIGGAKAVANLLDAHLEAAGLNRVDRTATRFTNLDLRPQ